MHSSNVPHAMLCWFVSEWLADKEAFSVLACYMAPCTQTAGSSIVYSNALYPSIPPRSATEPPHALSSGSCLKVLQHPVTPVSHAAVRTILEIWEFPKIEDPNIVP